MADGMEEKSSGDSGGGKEKDGDEEKELDDGQREINPLEGRRGDQSTLPARASNQRWLDAAFFFSFFFGHHIYFQIVARAPCRVVSVFCGCLLMCAMSLQV